MTERYKNIKWSHPGAIFSFALNKSTSSCDKNNTTRFSGQPKKGQEGDQVLPLLLLPEGDQVLHRYLHFFESSAVINISILDWQYSVPDRDEHY